MLNIQRMHFSRQNCVGVTAAPSHPQEDLSTDSDSRQPAPTNPLFSAFDLGGGRASNVAFTIGANGDIKNDEDESYNVKNGIRHFVII